MKILAFTKYGREAASTRQRFLQYFPSLQSAGITVDHHPLLGDEYVRGLATGKRIPVLATAASYVRRIGKLAKSSDFDLIWIYAELFPWLPALFEKRAFRSSTPVVYDIDDAFFVRYEGKPFLSGKLDTLMSRAAACVCGNEFLRDYAAQFCERSLVIPTVVDTAEYRPAPKAEGKQVVIGWIGSPSTWANVRPLLPLLERLCKERDVRFRAIGTGVQSARDYFPGCEFAEWREDSEIAEVQAMDIGIMPLLDQPFERGKSGYKLVQYMACGLPVVASPVGVNRQMVTPGENGFLASTEAEWREALERLIADPSLRTQMGKNGRALAERSYSLAVQAPRLISLFREVVSERAPASP